jgi:ribose transport system substrate-binding protein
LVIAMAVVSACSSSGGSSGQTNNSGTGAKFSIVYASPLPNSPDWKRSADYLQTWANSHNATVKVVGPADTVDIPTIVNDIQQAIPQKPNMILTCACAGGAFDAVLKQAKDAGIIVVTLAADSAPGTRNLFLGTNYETFGKNAADSLITKTGGKAKIGVIRQNGTVANQSAELAAFKNEIAGSPGMSIVADAFDNSDAATANTVMSQMLLAHPDLDAIWLLEGTGPGVIESTLKAAGKAPGAITVLGIDLQPATTQAIKDGYIWATEYQQFFDATPLAAQCALDLKNGKTLKSDVVDTGALLVTKDNLPSSLPPSDGTLPTSC